MKTSSGQPLQFHPTEFNAYWAQKFLVIGNATLAKEYPCVKKTIRRKAGMALAFLTICLIVVTWSKIFHGQSQTKHSETTTASIQYEDSSVSNRVAL